MYRLARYSATASHDIVLHTTVSEYTCVPLVQDTCILSRYMYVQSAVANSYQYT
jgi:hypothetical protein